MFTQLDLNKVLFMVELLISEHIYFFTRKRKENFLPRIIVSYFLCFMIALFFPILAYNAIYASVLFFILFVITIPFMKLCYDESWINIFFCCFAAFTVKEIAYAICQLVVASTSFFVGGIDYSASVGEFILGSYGNSSVQIISIFYCICDLTFYSITYLVCGLVFADRLKRGDPIKLNKVNFILFSVPIVVVEIVLNAIIVYHSQVAFDVIYYVIFMVFMAFGCTVAMALQFSILKTEQLSSEVLVFSHLLAEKEKQYIASKESVDIINQKCHDLKHMVNSWRKGRGIDDEELVDIEKAISIYDSAVKSGNKALDIILTEKSLICSKRGIALTCLADAEKLDFIGETDLYVLFGNILDNAIEAVQKIAVPEKKVISINIKQVGDILSVTVRNYYEGKLVMEDGIPRTSKGDEDYHGFGLKSAKRIVEKYDGSIVFDADGQTFTVSMIFPLPID